MFNFFKKKQQSMKVDVPRELIKIIEQISKSISLLSSSVNDQVQVALINDDRKRENERRGKWLRFKNNYTKMSKSNYFFINDQDIHVYITQGDFKRIVIPLVFHKYTGILGKVIAETIDNIFNDYVEIDFDEIIIRKFVINFFNEYCLHLFSHTMTYDSNQPLHEDGYYSGLLYESSVILRKEIIDIKKNENSLVLIWENKHGVHEDTISYDVDFTYNILNDFKEMQKILETICEY